MEMQSEAYMTELKCQLEPLISIMKVWFVWVLAQFRLSPKISVPSYSVCFFVWLVWRYVFGPLLTDSDERRLLAHGVRLRIRPDRGRQRMFRHPEPQYRALEPHFDADIVWKRRKADDPHSDWKHQHRW